MNYIWKNTNQGVCVPDDFAINYHPKIRSILYARGIDTEEKLSQFINPNVSDLHYPWLMKNMDRAVNRLEKAIDSNEKILVYGDYDVDGTTAISLVYSFLRDLHCNVDFYVPDRYTEGYGLSKQGMKWAVEQQFQLIISLDCGIKANEAIAYVQERGVDVIVCDHHNQGETLPNAYAVLDPKRFDCEYPFKELSGCGVGYKLLYAYCLQKKYTQQQIREQLNCYLDYVAISIASDIVPIVDENRVLMRFGLLKMQMKNKVLLPVRILLEHSGLGEAKSLSVSDIVFKISPKINAAGRIKSARDVISLLTATTEEDAEKYCIAVEEYNLTRREFDKNITQTALQMIYEDESLQQAKSTVLYDASWHKGVVGIVASRVIETFYKPTIILCGEGEKITGSARSVGDFDLYAAIDSCSDCLVAFGGHRFAAGLTLLKSNLEVFKERFEAAVSATIQESHLQPEIPIDAEIEAEDVTFEFYEQLEKLAPFGPQNMNPIFVIRGLYDSGSMKIGKDYSHMRFCLENENGRILSFIGFGMAEKWDTISSNKTFDVCFTISVDEYRGEKRLNLEAKDISVAKIK